MTRASPVSSSPQRLEELAALLRRHRRDLGLDRGRDDHRLGALGPGLLEHPRGEGVAAGGVLLVDVADVEHGLGGEQLRLVEHALLLGVLRPGEPRRLALAEQLQRLAEHAGRDLRLLVALRGLLGEGGDALLEAFEVGEHQLGLDRLGIGDRIDLVVDMLDVVVLEAAQHMDDRVDLADVAEELVAQPLALGGAAHEAGDVDEGELGLDLLRRARDLLQLVEPRIGDRDIAHVRLDRAEGIVGRLRRGGLRQSIEERRLAHVGEADDAAAEAHETLPVVSGRRGR